MNENLEDVTISVDDNGFAELTKVYENTDAKIEENSQATISSHEDINKIEEYPTIINDLPSEEVIYVLCPKEFQNFNDEMKEKKLAINKNHLNENSQAHFKKFIKAEGGKSDYTFSRAGLGGTMSTGRTHKSSVTNILCEKEAAIKCKEAIDNINKISQKILQEFEYSMSHTPVEKNLSDKLSAALDTFKEKAVSAKRNIFFSIVNRAQKMLNIK